MNFSIIEDYCFDWLSKGRKKQKYGRVAIMLAVRIPFVSRMRYFGRSSFIDSAVNLKSCRFWNLLLLWSCRFICIFIRKNIEPFSLNIYHLFWMTSILASPKFYSDKYVGKTFLISYLSEAFHSVLPKVHATFLTYFTAYM